MAYSVIVGTVAAEDEPCNRLGEAVLSIAVRYEIGRTPHIFAAIAHRDTEAAPLEHGEVVAAVAEDGDLRFRNSEQPRNFPRTRGPWWRSGR